MEIILVVEDLVEEQAKAKQVVLDSGAKVIIAGNLFDTLRFFEKFQDRLAGVLTDLHFPERDQGRDNNPNGLVVVIKALKAGIPVSICSNVDHHFCRYLKDVVAGLEEFTGKRIPFTMGKKDWQQALDELYKIREV